jgi:hypothetical protein
MGLADFISQRFAANIDSFAFKQLSNLSDNAQLSQLDE